MQTLRRTPLYERHVAAGARMVPFAGWEMPVQYEGVVAEHRARARRLRRLRRLAHGRARDRGAAGGRAAPVAARRTTSGGSATGEAQYTLLTNERGGIIDDLIVYRLDPFRFLLDRQRVEPRADFEWMKEREIPGSDVRDVSDGVRAAGGAGATDARAARACPRPHAFTLRGRRDRRRRLHGQPHRLHGRARRRAAVRGRRRAARSGTPCVERGAVPCGLGARDTLRLEVCYPLHGNDIGPDTDPISAGLAWTCALEKDFTGAEIIRRIRAEGPERRLVPFVMEEKAIPRAGHGDRGRRHGHLRHALADARPRHRHGVRADGAGRAGNAAHDRRARQAAPRASRAQADLQRRFVPPQAIHAGPWRAITGARATLDLERLTTFLRPSAASRWPATEELDSIT